MEPSQRKLSASAAVVLLVLAMAAEMAEVAEAGECLSESRTFKGICILSEKRCNDVCLRESSSYSGGKCKGLFGCYCITPCAKATAPRRGLAQLAVLTEA